jgi:hypothetical protein
MQFRGQSYTSVAHVMYGGSSRHTKISDESNIKCTDVQTQFRGNAANILSHDLTQSDTLTS